MIKEVIAVNTSDKEEFIDITDRVQSQIDQLTIKDGVVTLYIPHTTAGLIINENADPDVLIDIAMWLERAVPCNLHFRHLEGNSSAHIKSIITGNSLQVGVENGRLLLGTWQGIFFCEFDGPRTREIWLII